MYKVTQLHCVNSLFSVDRLRWDGGKDYFPAAYYWKTEMQGLIKTSPNRIEYPKEKDCNCLRRMVERIHQLNGFNRLDVLEKFLDAFAFEIPFNTVTEDIPKVKTHSCMEYEDLDLIKSAVKKRHIPSACKALFHRVRNTEMVYSEGDFIKKLKVVGGRKDIWYITSLLQLTSPNTMKRI